MLSLRSNSKPSWGAHNLHSCHSWEDVLSSLVVLRGKTPQNQSVSFPQCPNLSTAMSRECRCWLTIQGCDLCFSPSEFAVILILPGDCVVYLEFPISQISHLPLSQWKFLCEYSVLWDPILTPPNTLFHEGFGNKIMNPPQESIYIINANNISFSCSFWLAVGEAD